MKKKSLFRAMLGKVMVIAVLAFVLVVVGCDDGKGDGGSDSSGSSLSGTTWEGTFYGNIEILFGTQSETWTVKFTSSSAVTWTRDVWLNGTTFIDSQSWSGTYTVSGNTITCNYTNLGPMTYTRSGNTMTDMGFRVVLTKQ